MLGRDAMVVTVSSHVMIVDDENDILEELEELLASRGYTVTTSRCISEALQAFDTNPQISTLVTDLKLTGESGLDLVRACQRKEPPLRAGARFAVMTGQTDLTAALCGELDEAGIKLLTKPVPIGCLLSFVSGTADA